MSVQQIGRYEHGADRMSAAMLIRICTALQIPLAVLCDGIDDQANDGVGHFAPQPVSGAINQLVDDFVAIREASVRSQVAKLVASLAASSRRQQPG